MLLLFCIYQGVENLKIRACVFSVMMLIGFYIFTISMIEKKKYNNMRSESEKKVLSDSIKISSFKVKESLLSELESNLIYKSGIFRKFKFISIELVIVVSIVSFIFIDYLMILSFGFKMYSFIPGLLGFILPFMILDMIRKYNSQKSRVLLVNFISSIYRWSSVKEDIVFCFEKTLQMGIGKPIDSYIHEFLIQVNGGMSTIKALDIFSEKVDNDFFRTFIINIKHSVKCKGDLLKLLGNLEQEAYKIEEEFDRRKISLFKDKLMIYGIMFIVIFVFYFQLKTNTRVANFYLSSLVGSVLLTFYSLLFIVGLIMSLDLNKVEY